MLPSDDSYHGRRQGARVIIKPHAETRGSRPRRAYEPAPETSRGAALVGVLFGLAASVGLVYGAVQLTHVTWGEPPPAPVAAPASTPAASPSASPNDTGAAPAATPTAATGGEGLGSGQAWAMTAPFTAGGYVKHTPMPSGMLATGTANATALMQAVVLSGGKPDGGATSPKFVSADYLVPGNQAIGYVGFTGKFTPASVMDAFGKIANNVAPAPAGPHGGQLACGTMSANSGPSGTVCAWATTTSMGMVGFFGGGQPEHVTGAKAGDDVVKLRGDVETST